MALKHTIRDHPGGSSRCPLCQEQISREASKCPHCTADLSENEDWLKIQQSPANSGPGCSMALVVISLVLVTGWLVSILTSLS